MFEREPNIDVVFRNGLKNLEVLPPADVWDSIPPLAARRSRLRVVAAVAAGVALLLSFTFLATWYMRQNSTMPLLAEVTLNDGEEGAVVLDIPAASPVLSTYEPEMMTTDHLAAATTDMRVSPEDALRAAALQPGTVTSPSGTVASPSGMVTSPSGTVTASSGTVASSSGTVTTPPHTTSAGSTDQAAAMAAGHHSELLADAELPERSDATSAPLRIPRDEITVITARRFSGTDQEIRTPLPRELTSHDGPRITLGASLSPAMGFSRAGENIRLAELISSETARPSYSAGLTVGYQLSPRLTIQSGVGLASVGQTITDVIVYAGLSDHYSVKSSYLYSVQTASGLLLANNTDLYLTDSRNRVETRIPPGMADPSKYSLNLIGSEIQQVFRYLELPVMLRYRVIDRKVGLNLSGGVAYGFLVDNAAYTGKGTEMIYVGQTEGVSPFNLSSMVGLGMEYSFTSKMTFSLEPLFRYYVTPLSDVSGSLYKPYSVGFYSGFFFKF